MLEEEVRNLRSDILYQADEHEKDFATLELRFLAKYDLVEDELETLGEANQVLRGDAG